MLFRSRPREPGILTPHWVASIVVIWSPLANCTAMVERETDLIPIRSDGAANRSSRYRRSPSGFTVQRGRQEDGRELESPHGRAADLARGDSGVPPLGDPGVRGLSGRANSAGPGAGCD